MLTPDDEVHLDSTGIVAWFFQYSRPHQHSVDGIAQPEAPEACEGSTTKEIVSIYFCSQEKDQSVALVTMGRTGSATGPKGQGASHGAPGQNRHIGQIIGTEVNLPVRKFWCCHGCIYSNPHAALILPQQLSTMLDPPNIEPFCKQSYIEQRRSKWGQDYSRGTTSRFGDERALTPHPGKELNEPAEEESVAEYQVLKAILSPSSLWALQRNSCSWQSLLGQPSSPAA